MECSSIKIFTRFYDLHLIRSISGNRSMLFYICLHRSYSTVSVGIDQVDGVVGTVSVSIERQHLIKASQPRILLQEPADRRVIPPHAHLLQPARQRFVPIAPRAVPVVGRTRTCNRVAERISQRSRSEPTTGATRRRQVAAQVPVLVFRACADYLKGNCTRSGWRGENSPPTPLTVPTLLGLMGLDGANAVPESYTQEDG